MTNETQSQERNKRDRSSSISSTNTSEKSEPHQKKGKMGDGQNGDAEQIPSCTDEEEKDESDKDSLFGSDIGTSQACYICLEDFYEGRGEGRIAQPCGHIFCAECWLLWVTFLQKMRVAVKCPKCRECVEGVDDW